MVMWNWMERLQRFIGTEDGQEFVVTTFGTITTASINFVESWVIKMEHFGNMKRSISGQLFGSASAMHGMVSLIVQENATNALSVVLAELVRLVAQAAIEEKVNWWQWDAMDQMALSQRVRKLKIEFKSPDRNVHYFESHNWSRIWEMFKYLYVCIFCILVLTLKINYKKILTSKCYIVF